MKRSALLAVASCAAVGLTAVPAQGAVKIFVAPGGSDAAAGTKRAPYATVARAQERVRELTPTMSSNVVVNLREGTYRLDEPLELTDAAGDSGQNGHRVIYQAYGYGSGAQEDVTISGGQEITGWTLDAGLWRAEVGDLETRQLYVDGKRAPRAALGTAIPGNVRNTATGYETDSVVPQSWSNPEDIELVHDGRFNETHDAYDGVWGMAQARCGVESITGDRTSTTITVEQPCFDNGNTLYAFFEGYLSPPTNVENSPSFLTEPGTFYLDRSDPGEHVLFYKPRSGETIGVTEAVAPVLDTLVSGTGEERAPLHDVTFRGLTFAHAGWLVPNEPAGLIGAWSIYMTPELDSRTVPGNVRFHTVERIKLVGNRFQHMGAQALELTHNSSHNLVRGNVITDVSDGGILIGAATPEREGVNVGNRIDNNWIHHVGVEYHGASGIWTELTQSQTIAHNQINDVPYAGILSGHEEDLRGIEYDNRIVGNRIDRAMQVLDDGGGIYMRGEQGPTLAEGALIRGNVITDSRRDATASVTLGIYTDDTTNRVRLRDNVVYDHLAAFGGCSYADFDAPVANVRYVGNFWDAATPEQEYLIGTGRYPGAWFCGDPVDMRYRDNTELGHTDPAGACALNVACAAIVARAGITPAWQRLLD